MTRHKQTLGRAYFDTLYKADPDPWRFATSAYEREKYAATIACLTEPVYRSGLEVGCSIGVLTRSLATRCEKLLALDLCEPALAQARQNCPASHVTFENRQIPAEWPPGTFDLIVLSEVLYYLAPAELGQVAIHAHSSLLPSGIVVLVHYLGETDYPLTGDRAAELFIEKSGLEARSHARTTAYRIDILSGPETTPAPGTPQTR